MKNIKNGSVINYIDVGEKFYLIYDVTDPYHNIEIGFAYDLNEAKPICRRHCKEFPGSKIQVYEMIKE